MANEGSYTMKVNQGNKTIDMTVSGSFTPEKAEEFVADYKRIVAGVKANEYTLKFDCRDLNVVTQEMIPPLEFCMKLYKESGFEKVEVGIKKSAIIKMQLNRIARSAGLTNFEVAEIY
ncbi:hypothetical protein [Oceanobacillus chungangensis]|uniref:STAS domain-containing protein n=1 Tax=Oceanobacillus chungangensis TaxID=1229152 RepID=A0A3D8PJB6_9BACI|nr:hypothetical protein [Oceanobacillus chungangensis]RDW16186.1 hypothetical protein CWR45_15020 [Oceanobacillus chungangensis]